MYSSVKNFLQLILEISLNLSLIVIYKDLGISQVFAEECFKLVLRNRDRVICILFLLVLLSAEANLILKKRHNKKDLVSALGSSSGKVIFVLLTKVKTFCVGFTAIYIQQLGLEKLVSRFFERGRGLSLQNCFKNLLQVFVLILEDRECSDKNNNNRKVYP